MVWEISLTLDMTYCLSPIGTLCHFASAADAPLLSLSRHFPRFIGGIYPEGGSKLLSLRAERSKLPGGLIPTEYKFRTFSVGYFAYAQYDVKKRGSFANARYDVLFASPEGGSELLSFLTEVKNPAEELIRHILLIKKHGASYSMRR